MSKLKPCPFCSEEMPVLLYPSYPLIVARHRRVIGSATYWLELEAAWALAKEYLETIKGDNSKPTHVWNSHSAGVLGLIAWLENQLNENQKPEGE